MAKGKGGFIASDLTPFAAGRSATEVREEIVNPTERGGRENLAVARVGDNELRGMVRNEDNFSMQLQTLDGAFHLLLKSEIERLTRQSASLMHADYKGRLSGKELDDLISFLMDAAKHEKSLVGKKAFREDEENE